MERDLLVAELVLLGEQQTLLVLQSSDVVGRLRDLGGERQVEEDADQNCPQAEVGVAECIQLQAVGSDRARDLHEAASPPAAPGGNVLRAGRA